MKKWKLWVGMFLVFLAGGGIGAATTGLYVRHQIISALNEGPPAVTRLVIHRLTQKLDLDASQQIAIRDIVLETQQELMNIRRHYQPETKAVIVDSLAKMRRELNPEQQRKLEKLYQRFKNRWASSRDDEVKGRSDSIIKD